MTTRLPEEAEAKSPLAGVWAAPPSPGPGGRPPPLYSLHRHRLRKDSAQFWGRSAGINLAAKFDPCHSRISRGRDLRAARACAGGAALQPAASDEPCPRSRGHSGVTQADAGGQRPAPPADPSERPAAPSVSRSTASRRAGGGMPESRRLGAGEAGSRHRRRGCPPPASRRRDPERCARPHSGIPRFTWSGEGAGGSPERAGGQEGAASALLTWAEVRGPG